MSDARWKQFERRLARSLGTRRIPVTGERAGADFQTPRFVYQAKKGRRFPAYLARWLDEICETGARRGKVGVLVWQERGATDSQAAVVLRFRDWMVLHGEDRAATEMPRQRFATLPAAICARPGCRRPLPPRVRRHGSPRRFCAARCRWLAWTASHPRIRREGRRCPGNVAS